MFAGVWGGQAVVWVSGFFWHEKEAKAWAPFTEADIVEALCCTGRIFEGMEDWEPDPEAAGSRRGIKILAWGLLFASGCWVEQSNIKF